MNNLISRLRKARSNSGLTQQQVAKLIGIHRPTISDIENGQRKITTEELLSFAKIYEVSPSWLLGIKEKHIESDDLVRGLAQELATLKQRDLNKVLKLLASIHRSKRTSNR